MSRSPHAGPEKPASAGAEGTGVSPDTRSTARAPRSTLPSPLKAAAIPVLLTVGTLLLLPLAWAVAILLGLDTWRSDWPGARTMAVAMLACAPIAASLYAAAWWFHRELRGGKLQRR